jgi:hypothetical protein
VKKSWIVVLACALVTVTAAAQDLSAGSEAASTLAAKGKMVQTSNGARLGVVYRVGSDGSAQMILKGRVVAIPASTLSSVDGRLTTSLSKSEVLAIR